MTPDPFKTRLRAARDGDETAWSQLYLDLAPGVLGYLRGTGLTDPEDVLGEVFLQVSRDVQRFDGDERQFRAWVYKIAHHRLIDARRREARRPLEFQADPPETELTVADASDEALDRIGAAEVRSVLSTLSPDQRAVLLLRLLGDLTVGEVAETVGKRQGAVKALQRRGLIAVQRELERRGVPL